MLNADRVDWDKGGGLVPAVVQDAATHAVLMLGYMNRAALAKTYAMNQVTFWSRSKARLWTKGESSGNFLTLRSIEVDCDGDALLVLADPSGPACHRGTRTCWGDDVPGVATPSVGTPGVATPGAPLGFLSTLEQIIERRIVEKPDGSYTAKLLSEGTRRIAQKVGEEGLELALAAVAQSNNDVLGEAADLLYHTMLLLQVKGLSLKQVTTELERRHIMRAGP